MSDDIVSGLNELGFTAPEEMSEETLGKLEELVKSSSVVSGLSNALSRVKEERDTFKGKVAEIENESKRLEREKLESEGKFEELLSLERESKSKLLGRIEQEKKASTVQLLSSKFSDPKMASFALNNFVQVSHDEQGNLVESFTIDGQSVASNVDEFSAYLAKDSYYSSLMKAPESKTAQAAGGSSSGSAPGKKRSEMSAAEKHEYIAENGQKAFLQLPK